MTFDDEVTVARPVRAAAVPGTWFEAASPLGLLRLHTGDAGTVRHAADAALALLRCEALLAELDAWSDRPLDWRWSGQGAHGAHAAQGAHAMPVPTAIQVGWRGGSLRLVLPWAWVRARPAPSASLAAELDWPRQEAVLGIARLRLSSNELQDLEPGGALLLPPSMRPGWTGLLRAETHDFANDADAAEGVPVSLTDPRAPRLLRRARPAAVPESATDVPSPVAGDPSGVLCELRLALRRGVLADRLAGWHTESLHDLVHDDLAASLWRCAGKSGPARCLAQGNLLPWGDGWALGLAAVAAPFKS